MVYQACTGEPRVQRVGWHSAEKCAGNGPNPDTMREKWSQNDDMPKLPYALHLGKLVFFVELWQEKEAVAVKLRELVAIERPGRGEVGGVGVPRGRRDAVV